MICMMILDMDILDNMKTRCLEYNGKYAIMAFNEDEMCVGTITIDTKCNEYPRYYEYCNGDKLAKIIRVETNPHYVGQGIASKLIKLAIKKFKDYNLVLLCDPQKRWEDTDTLKTISDLQMFYSKFGFIRTNELLPTMILKANI